MQASVPGVMDVSNETPETFALYGKDSGTPGTFAANCLLARRLAERGVKFIQLYHQGWDQHDNLPRDIQRQCRETDQASAALITDLKQRGLLDDTLVVWGGEFGRTSYSQGKLTATNYGRDHHPRCFTVWMAGGGVKPGLVYGATDDFSYNVAEDGVHVHDLHATMLQLLGVDHERLTYFYQGRRFRLTDVHGKVVTPSAGVSSANGARYGPAATPKLWHLPICEAAPEPFHRAVAKSRQPPVAEGNLRRVDHEHEQHLLRTRHAPMAHGIAVKVDRADQ